MSPIDPDVQFHLQQLPGPMAQLHQAAALQGLEQENQVRALQVQQAQKQMQAQQILDNAYKTHFQNGELDMNGVYTELANSGQGHMIPALQESHAKLQKTLADAAEGTAKLQELHESLAAGLGAQMESMMDGTPKGYENAAGWGSLQVANYQKKGLMSPDEVTGMVGKFDPNDPDTLRATVKAMQAPAQRRAAQKIQEEQGKPIVAPVTSNVIIPSGPGGQPVIVQRGQQKPEPLEAKTMLVDDKAAQTNFNKDTGKYYDPVTGQDITARVKPIKSEFDPSSTVTQEKLEQEYRGILQREMSSRSGGLGVEDQKVNQANHLMALLNQFEGKNMPAQVQAELALGMARLTSPSGAIGIELEQEFNQRTAQSGLSQAIAWLTGDPQLVNATPEALRGLFRDTIQRQGEVAVQNREGYFNAIRSMAPTDLNEERRTKLEKGMGLNPFRSKPGAAAGGTTHMKAPDGRDMPSVPNAEVDRLKALGATVVQ